ncbi:MAG: hypothetical protein NVS3B20_10250 [Polyangiales bacterium]
MTEDDPPHRPGKLQKKPATQPDERASAPVISPPGTQSAAVSCPRILIIDDSKTARDVLKIYLMSSGYEFTDVESATRGLTLLKLMDFDLVVVDVNMPGLDGLSFVKQVRALDVRALSKVPIIVITSDRSPDLVERAKAAGANATFRKPVDAAALADEIKQLLGVR